MRKFKALLRLYVPRRMLGRSEMPKLESDAARLPVEDRSDLVLPFS